MLIKAKAQATKDKAVMVHASWIEKHWLYSKAVISSTAKGAWNVAKAIPKGLIDILGDMAKVQQLDDEGKYAAMSGNAQMQNQAEQQMVQLGNQEYGWIDKTITFIDFLFKDEQTRDILETFAKDYYNSESKLMVSKQTAEAFGGFAMAIVAAIVTKKVTAFAPEVAGTDAFSELGPEIDNIASTLKEIDQCEEVSGAEVDREHVVQAALSPSETAKNFQGSRDYPGVDKYVNKLLKKGQKIYAGEPGLSGFFTSDDDVKSTGFDAVKLFKGLQVAPRNGTYRPLVTEFIVENDIMVAVGKAMANPQYGEGGFTQYFIPNHENNVTRIKTYTLKNTTINNGNK